MIIKLSIKGDFYNAYANISDGTPQQLVVQYTELPAVSETELSITPNPFVEQVTLSYRASEGQEANIVLCDVTGRVVATQRQNTITGVNLFIVDGLDILPAGLYTASLVLDGQLRPCGRLEV